MNVSGILNHIRFLRNPNRKQKLFSDHISMAACCTHSASLIWLVKATNEDLQTSKLQSHGEALKVLFHYQTAKTMSLKESIERSASSLLPIWKMGQTPASNHTVLHIHQLHSDWQGLAKNIHCSSTTNLKNQAKFKEGLEDHFDIPHQDLTTIKIEEDPLFLLTNCEKACRGKLCGIDKALAWKKERALKRKIAADNYTQKANSTVTSETAATAPAPQSLPPISVPSDNMDVQLNLSQSLDVKHEADSFSSKA